MPHTKTGLKKKTPPEKKVRERKLEPVAPDVVQRDAVQRAEQQKRREEIIVPIKRGGHTVLKNIDEVSPSLVHTEQQSTEQQSAQPEPQSDVNEASVNKTSANKKTNSEKSQDSKRNSDRFGYDRLARQTLDLWRDQLAHFLNNPDAMKDLGKVMEPSASFMPPQFAQMFSPQITQMFPPFFSNGMDLWLMMLEQLSKAATMNAKGGSEQQNEHKTTSQSKTGQGGDENRPSTASALSGAGTYAVAQLASRIADLEKRVAELEGAAKPAAKAPAAKKKPAPPVVVAVKRVK